MRILSARKSRRPSKRSILWLKPLSPSKCTKPAHHTNHIISSTPVHSGRQCASTPPTTHTKDTTQSPSGGPQRTGTRENPLAQATGKRTRQQPSGWPRVAIPLHFACGNAPGGNSHKPNITSPHSNPPLHHVTSIPKYTFSQGFTNPPERGVPGAPQPQRTHQRAQTSHQPPNTPPPTPSPPPTPLPTLFSVCMIFSSPASVRISRASVRTLGR